MSFWADVIKDVAPVAVSTLAGPAGPVVDLALSALGNALGIDSPTQQKIQVALQAGQLTGDQKIALQSADNMLKYQLAQIAGETKRVGTEANVDIIKAINGTMVAEAASDHWPTYTWRPFIGFCFGILAMLVGLLTFAVYAGVMFKQYTGMDQGLITTLPAMITSMIGVLGIMSPILGIASYFRGKAQADPNVNTDNRG